MPKISVENDQHYDRPRSVKVDAPVIPDDEHDKAEEQEKHVRDGLPRQAFAIVPDQEKPATWKLPHHTRAIFRYLKGRLRLEATVDRDRLPLAAAALSKGGYRGQRVEAPPGAIAEAAAHLAQHYTKAGRPIPDSLRR